MSIEKLIADHIAALNANTAAVKELTEVWGKLRDRAVEMREAGTSIATASAGGVPLADAPKAETKAPKAEKAAKTEKPAATPAATETAPSADAATEPAAGSPSDVVYTRDDLQAAISKFAKTHRDDVVAALQAAGAKRGSEVKDADVHKVTAQILALGAEDDLS